jgi:hypothetical protein
MTRGTGTAPRRGRTCQGLLGGHDPNGVCQEFEVAEHALERVHSQFGHHAFRPGAVGRADAARGSDELAVAVDPCGAERLRVGGGYPAKRVEGVGVVGVAGGEQLLDLVELLVDTRGPSRRSGRAHPGRC